MEGTAIVVEVRVDPDDLKQCQAFIKRLPTSRPAQRIVRLAVAVHLAVAVVFLVGMYSMGQDHWGWWLAFGAYVAQPLIAPFVQRLSWRAFAETFNGRLTFEPSGLTMDRPGYSSHVSPSALVDVNGHG